MTMKLKRLLFFTLTGAVLFSFLYLWLFRKEAFERPALCACKDVYDTDSTKSVRAARLMVGIGHYNFTIQTARRYCDSAYRTEILSFSGASGYGLKGEGIGKDYFDQRCP
jgi:hypothetical protein